ncbi:MAG: right-handed parallel beta-helix repeat-containing protein [Rhodobacterales bacterium]|nr:right-handed parallel beta-helix repeat-containing protein [Rhodobacterales bacterium]
MTVILVSSVAELYTALSTSGDGDIIELAPGEYDRISIWKGRGFDVNFDGPVTIRSADPDNPAVIRSLEVSGASNLVFDSLHFDYDAPPGTKTMDRPYEILKSDNITIKNSVFDGDLAEGVGEKSDGFATGLGLGVRSSANVTIENNEFFNFYKALSFGQSTDAIVRGNDIHSIRCDGLTMTKVVGALIEDNFIHDFARNVEAGDHSDMIQFWTAGTPYPSADITIRNNRLDIGDGHHTQSIFMGNEAVGKLPEDEKASMYYKNITIEDNLIINGHLHGITIGAVDGLNINNNTLLHSNGGFSRNGGFHEQPIINVNQNSTNVTLTDNVAARYPADNADWTVSGNKVVQDYKPGGAGYYPSAEDFLNGDFSGSSIEPGENGTFTPIIPEPGSDAFPATPPAPGSDASHIYSADFNALAMANMMRNGATYEAESGGFRFDGSKGAVSLGKLHDFSDTDQIMVNMNFMLNDASDAGHLFNNHMRLSASVSGNAISLKVATEDEGFKSYKITGLDMITDKEHQLTLILDREEDHLQVVLNGEVILEDMETDFASRDGMHNWDWSLGNFWHDSFDGTMTAFSLSNQAEFLSADPMLIL